MKNNDSPQKNDNDVEAIKKDVKDIVNRISKFDKDTIKELYNDSEGLFSEFNEIKDKIAAGNKSSVLEIKEKMCSCIGKNPVTSAMCYMGMGAIFTMLLRK